MKTYSDLEPLHVCLGLHILVIRLKKHRQGSVRQVEQFIILSLQAV